MKTSNPTCSTDTDYLSLDAQLCFALYSSMLGINKAYRKLLKDLNLTYPQYLVMLVLWEKDGVNVSEICDQLFLETTTLTPLLKRLEVSGLIRRQRSSLDERQVIITLTDAGRTLREEAKGIPQCISERVGYSREEVDQLRENLVNLRKRLFNGTE
ncbi:MarR family winged helix-turn-helix transcriptional regulator [Aquirhabdus parva]|uniref:MarR family transcriptional regulator n=1 Tax=Aquirhabdus parva TaxID=2283318 RepID=A0A345P4Q6_9GAMM|nr:MarR family winged helix-turn-helix transcriptional regulator [Aquirhabdus parva]AXI02265.1 MarR family transcriptional regulator [Aquirhabdus parva]